MNSLLSISNYDCFDICISLVPNNEVENIDNNATSDVLIYNIKFSMIIIFEFVFTKFVWMMLNYKRLSDPLLNFYILYIMII